MGKSLGRYLDVKGFETCSYDLVDGYDIANYDQLNEYINNENPDMIYHLAAQAFLGPGEEDPYNDIRVNQFGIINLLKCLEDKDIPMVYTSSGAVYGVGEIPHRESNVCIPVSNYGVSKLAAENYLRKWVVTTGIDAKVVRFSSVYGPHRKHGPVNIFINKALANEPLTIFGTGAQTRDMLHIEDAVRGLDLVMERGKRGEVYNIGIGEENSVAEVAKIIQRFLGAQVIYAKHDLSVFDLSRSWYDISKARTLGFRPRLDLTLGISSTIFDMQEGKD